ncbi:MAG: hypothetical protein L0Z62_29410 [Gemmataceae bacterium]|nr:hypothetical protein [Gemmataceae bacterium]
MLERSQLALAVGHADVAAHMAFHSSMDYFHTGDLDRRWWKDVRSLSQIMAPLTLTERAFAVVEGDVLADVALSDGGTLVIYGDVRASIRTSGQCEVVVAGGVMEAADVSGGGILHLFVGGDLAGSLRSQGACKAWVQGDLRGEVWTGHPATELRVLGNCNSPLRPSDEPALLYLEVDGFMPYALLEATAAVGYTMFNASVGTSDRPAGLYPDRTTYEALEQHRSYNRWVIREGLGKQR